MAAQANDSIEVFTNTMIKLDSAAFDTIALFEGMAYKSETNTEAAISATREKILQG